VQANDNPKILLLDIEWKPAIAYVWQMYDVTVSLNQLIDSGGMLCVAAKWLGEKKTHFFAEWEHGRQGMAEGIHALMSAADAWVGYNSDRYDLPKLRGEFVLAKLPPPPPVASIDIYRTVKKLGFVSGKLAYIGPLLTGEGKVKHEGMELWTKAMGGCEKAQRTMKRYNIQDVVLLEDVYLRVRPYIANHPHLGMTGPLQCGACGSNQVQSRGVRRTKSSFIQRHHCQACGSWFDGRRARVA
jgi:hypothetical protein